MKNGRASKPPDHRATPISKRQVQAPALACEIPDVRLVQVIHQETPDGNLSADVSEDAYCAEKQVAVLPDAVVGPNCCVASFCLGDLRELKPGDDESEQD